MEKEVKKSYNLSEGVIKSMMDTIFTKSLKNRDAFIDMVYSIFSEQQLQLLLEVMNMKTVYKKITKDCYVKVIPASSWDYLYEPDVLADRGLLSDDGRLFGQVIGDTGWDSGKFNAYYYKFKVTLFVLDDEGKIKKNCVQEVEPDSLEIIKATDIKLLKAKIVSNGTDITQSVSKRVPGVAKEELPF